MVNPMLIKKSDIQQEISNNAKRLFQAIYNENNEVKKDDNTPRIKVSDLISKMAFYYEKIRNSVDYKEEYLHRKNAILRILKRQTIIHDAIAFKELQSEEISIHLITELIRAGYLPNNKIPETKIEEVLKIISKYLKLKNFILKNKTYFEKNTKVDESELKNNIINLMISLMASEIEENFREGKINKTVVSSMYEILSTNLILPPASPYEKDKDIQIYISICKTYLKYDQDMLTYVLFKYYNSNWQKEVDNNEIEKIGKNINTLIKTINFQLIHPLANQLNPIINRYTVYYTILSDVIEADPVNVYNNIKTDPKSFPRLIKQTCEKKYKSTKSKLWRAAVRSIIYIFITKSVFAALLEIPATLWLGEKINYESLFINISFPSILLFILVLFTKLPSEENTQRIVNGIEDLSFKKVNEQEKIYLNEPRKRSATINIFFGLFYFITFFLSFGLVIWALDRINFNWISATIFLFFLAFASFFSVRIRKGAHELMIVDEKEGFLSFIFDFFYIPIIAVGKWLSEKFSKINVFVFIMDFIIEAPFKIFVEIAEEWTKYVRERKEELRR